MRGRILIVEDERDVREEVRDLLRDEGYEVEEAADGEAGLAAARARPPELVLLDLRLPGLDGLEILRRLRAEQPQTAIVIVTACGTVESAIEALRAGAYDYLLKPVRFDDLTTRVGRIFRERDLAAENHLLRRELERRVGAPEIVGRSRPIDEVRAMIARVGPSGATILVSGETGTGKELVARAIHEASPRRGGKFVAVNAAAIPEALLEEQLFGHVRGAYTDARADALGLFRAARGGTLLLDEVSSLPLALQPKLLRAIETKEVLPVGASVSERVDVRLVAASNRDLAAEVRAGRFRDDLYFRLNVVEVRVPPLRERREDLPLLAGHFLERLARESGKRFAGIAPAAMRALLEHDWPGNVRELENAIERAVILGQGGLIGPELLPAAIAGRACCESSMPDALEAALRSCERGHILRVLFECGYHRRHTAARLGVSPTTLWRRLRELEIDVPEHLRDETPGGPAAFQT